MTAYFDTFDTKVHQARALPEYTKAAVLEELEGELVRAVTVCAEWPGLSPSYRKAIHEVVLRYGVTTLPESAPRADFENDDQYAERLHLMSSDLHSIFHAIRRDEGETWGDSPLSPLKQLCESGDAYRDALAQGKEPSPQYPGTSVVARALHVNELEALYRGLPGFEHATVGYRTPGTKWISRKNLGDLAVTIPEKEALKPPTRPVPPALAVYALILAERLPTGDYLIRA